MKYYDSHCHLQDGRLSAFTSDVLELYKRLGVAEVVTNGTGPDDWEAVAVLARDSELVKPSFGVHPWKVNKVVAHWKLVLSQFWDLYPEAGVGEIGLDRWIEGHDLAKQEPVFLWQLRQAAERDMPVSIHCLRAWGRMQELLNEGPLPARGFLLHSYGGPLEMVQPLAKLGAYFSISGYFELENKEKQRTALKEIPLDRILIETDAPDMLGPNSSERYRFNDDDSLNHPANIVNVYAFVARLFDMPLEELAGQVESNYLRFFCSE
ncbi:TatD family hydrolase [Pelagicoccus sp. SDUM812002]|uniref:TatD family hydrolase n=1 Tax=Pelagicoccus sp. SDUM812002 TaxID=3041266 RepID=UPI00280EE8E1|nr:TatD family hydrolase [Pelagicoccus sp. SDUM812002]MDQ8184429.1 TatD family hydrolase [Pelagicoccus sp. SDUM812002]